MNLRTTYDRENREIEAIDAEIDDLMQTIRVLSEQDKEERVEDLQDSLESDLT